MARKKTVPSLEELRKEVIERLSRWKHVKAHGTDDPFYPDGINLNLIRMHVISARQALKDRCKIEKIRPCPKEAKIKLPPILSNLYMAPRSKAAKHSDFKIHRTK
jgi:hypothetical protein